MPAQEQIVEIIQATGADLDQLVPLFEGYRQFYQQAPDLPGARRFLQAYFEQQTSVIFLAWQTDTTGQRRSCGFAQLYPSFSSVSMKRLWILNDLFVTPTARCLGVSRALLERARQLAVETGAKGLSLTTAVDNVVAQAAYEAAGWQRDREFYTYHLLV